MTHHPAFSPALAQARVTLRSPAELADALPYLMGFQPDGSVVMLALHGSARSRFGERLYKRIPDAPERWLPLAEQLAQRIAGGGDERLGRPDAVIVFLCQDPAGDGVTPAATATSAAGAPSAATATSAAGAAGAGAGAAGGRAVMERLRPLAQRLRTACGELDIPVVEALCLSGGRWWSYVCPDPDCCPVDGTPLMPRGTSVISAAASYAGITVRGSLDSLQARFAPLGPPRRSAQERALDAVAAAAVPRIILGGGGVEAVREETAVTLEQVLRRFADAAPPECCGGQVSPEAAAAAADAADDDLLGDDEAARIIIGLQDRLARDRAAEWMEPPESGPALRVWRAVARRCVGAFGDHAAPPLTLAGWVAWSMGDEAEARVAFNCALEVDPHYAFAKLLDHACDAGLDPEPLRQCLRAERVTRVGGE